jgi:hypothetical protein
MHFLMDNPPVVLQVGDGVNFMVLLGFSYFDRVKNMQFGSSVPDDILEGS